MDRFNLDNQGKVSLFSKGQVAETGFRIAHIVFLSLVLCVLSSPGRAQITISVDEIPATPGVMNEYAIRVGDSIEVDLGFHGGPQTWDFSQPPPPDTINPLAEHIVAVGETPFGDLFPDANIAIETEAVDIVGFDSTNGYQFMKLDEDSYDFLGLGFTDTAGTPFVIDLDSPLMTIPVPLTYGDTWSDRADFSGLFEFPNPEDSPLPGEFINVKVDLEYSREGEVDGWGTVTTALDEYEALRVRRHETTYINFSVLIFIGYYSIFDTTLSFYMYDWYAEDVGPVVSITSRPFEPDSLFTYATSVRQLISTNIFDQIPGDINDDKVVNLQDVLISVNHILGFDILRGEAFDRADCNSDGNIDLLDVFGLVSVIMGVGQCEPFAGKPEPTPEMIEFLESLKPYFSAHDFARFMSLVKGEPEVPGAYSLDQNYPNPFNSTTEIGYQIPTHDSPVQATLKIYNMLGQVVVTLVDEEKDPGSYKVSWDGRDVQGRDVASGVYFYRFAAGDFTATKRMLLMK